MERKCVIVSHENIHSLETQTGMIAFDNRGKI